VEKLTEEHDAFYRKHYETVPGERRQSIRGYEAVRPAYHLGYLASINPDYEGKSFDEIEAELERGWTSDPASGRDEWGKVRHFAADGYELARKRSPSDVVRYSSGRAEDRSKS
jgi:hypothetical protein